MTRLTCQLTEEILRREVFHCLADDFPTTWEAAQTAIVTLQPYPKGGTGALRVAWRGKRVARYFMIESLDHSLDQFSREVVTDVVDSLRQQIQTAEVGAADWGGP